MDAHAPPKKSPAAGCLCGAAANRRRAKHHKIDRCRPGLWTCTALCAAAGAAQIHGPDDTAVSSLGETSRAARRESDSGSVCSGVDMKSSASSQMMDTMFGQFKAKSSKQERPHFRE